MEKKILNTVIFALLYFEQLGKKYNESDRKETEAARVNFAHLLNKGKLDKTALSKAKAKYLSLLSKEFDQMTLLPLPVKKTAPKKKKK
jgi:hypothetical protein